MATIRERVHKSGAKVYLVRYRVNKKDQYRSFKKRKDADAFMAETVNSIYKGDYQPVKDILFKDLANKWLDMKKPKFRPKVYGSYKAHVNRLIEKFGPYTVRHISAEVVEGYAGELVATELSAATINRCLTIMRGIFKAGVRWNYLAKDPSTGIERPKNVKREMDFLTIDEVKRLIAATDERYRTLIMTACLSGMRQSEVLALRWSDCDFNSGKLFVRQVLQGGKFYEPKTDTSRRAVRIPKSLIEALQIHRAQQAVELAQNEHNLVFTAKTPVRDNDGEIVRDENGKSLQKGVPIISRNLAQRVFEPALQRAGIRKVGFHALRHSYVSVLVNQGQNIKFIQQQVGHASAKITWDVYSHLFDSTENDAITQLENTIFGSNTVTVV